MVRVLFDRTSLLFVGGSRWDDIPHDPNLFVQLSLNDFPDKKMVRLNATADGTRRATPAEIQAAKNSAIGDIEIRDVISVLENKIVITRAEVQAAANARRRARAGKFRTRGKL